MLTNLTIFWCQTDLLSIFFRLLVFHFRKLPTNAATNIHVVIKTCFVQNKLFWFLICKSALNWTALTFLWFDRWFLISLVGSENVSRQYQLFSSYKWTILYCFSPLPLFCWALAAVFLTNFQSEHRYLNGNNENKSFFNCIEKIMVPTSK